MTVTVRLAALALAALWGASDARAQEFQPPSSSGGGGPGRLRLDLVAFSQRTGVDVTGDVQWVLGSTIDIAELWSPRVRLRPSFELGSDGENVSYHVAGEVIYRFQPDDAPAIPYVGAGVGRYDQEGCPNCPKVWPTIVMGFELHFRPSFNWLMEYHALDRLGRHRFLVGLAARGATGGS